MPGFFGYKSNNKINFSLEIKDNLINEEIRIDNIYIHRHTIKKFLNDKIFKETPGYFLLLDGILLNITDLKQRYNTNDLTYILQKLYEEHGEKFCALLKGSFSGLLYDKIKGSMILFTDQIGTKQLFYYKDNDYFIFSSEIVDILQFCKEVGISITLNKIAAYLMLTNSYYFEDITLINEIKKLPAGTFINFSKVNLNVRKYYLLKNKPGNFTDEDEIIEKIDELFKQALRRSLKKNREYQYKNMASLSGGLDSRMTTWVLNEIKEDADEVINYTYSQSNYLDESIAKSIANYLGNTFIFKSLDNGLSMMKLDEATKVSEGMISYPALGQLVGFTELFNFNEIGIVHTGMMGDAVIGDHYIGHSKNNEINIFDKATSLKLKDKLNGLDISGKYENQEMFNFYSRGFSGMNLATPLIFQQYTETYSPYYDIDFMEYCLSIPLKFRINYYIYYKWILKKYPDASRYKWEKTNSKITALQIKIKGKKIPLKQLIPKILTNIGILNSSLKTKRHMNPYDYWYNNNSKVKNFMDLYFDANINVINNIELKNDCKLLYAQDKTSEKCLVLSLLAAIKLFLTYGLSTN